MIWLASILPALVLTAADPAATVSPPPAALAGPAPIFTRQAMFAIPFHIAAPARSAQEAVKVQLYVSGDHGARWDRYREAEPAKQQFLFRAGADGEFWFSVRTLDRSGQLRPAGPMTAELKVIVDTAPPKLQLEARRGDVGQVTVSFRIDEAYPKFDTLAIQYRTDNAANWQTVAVGPRDIRSSGSQHTGDVTLWPPAGAASMELRAQMTDMAGNPADSHAQILLNAGPATTPVATPEPSRRAETPKATGPDPPVHWPGETPGSAERRPASTGTVPFSSKEMRDSPLAAAPMGSSVAMRVNPAVGSEVREPFDRVLRDAPGAAQKSSLTIVANRPPTSEPIRWVNSRSFAVEYSAESVGPSGVGKVELWGTRDGGQTWKILGTDTKRQSPMHVTVNEPGVYGFRIAVQNAAGRGGNPPGAGERPEVWIGIDVQPPTVRILSAQQGKGAEADRLTIQWEASDNEQLAARPMALSYSETPGGPWTTIAKEIENSGHFNWVFDDGVPPRIYLRVEARDEAGNVGRYDLPQPLLIDRSATTVRIRPVGQASERPLEGHWWR